MTLNFGHGEPEYSVAARFAAGGQRPADLSGVGAGGGSASGGDSASGSAFSRIPRRVLIGAAGLLGVGLFSGIAGALSGSSGASGKGKAAVAGAKVAPPAPSPKRTYPPATITTVPADGASGVDPSQPVVVTAAYGTVQSVVFSGGQTTAGTLSANKSVWTSTGTLGLSTQYQMQVQVLGYDGKAVSTTVGFTTLTPTATIDAQTIWPGSNVTVGVGQPVRIQFTNSVSQEYRADVEKACVVTTSPPVPGAWYWPTSDMMDWRPQNFWAVNSQISVAFNLSGVRAGQSQFFTRNHSINYTIRNTDLRLIVDTLHFSATCYENGQAVRTFPISAGMSSQTQFISWSGTMAVLSKGNPVLMQAHNGPSDTYSLEVYWATQTTYSGTYVHAAPWDPEIGIANDDSHGCIHCHPVDAQWFYQQNQIGDVVQVTGTNRIAAVDNGFCDWTMAWPDWVAQSNYGPTMNGQPVTAAAAGALPSASPGAITSAAPRAATGSSAG